MWRALGDVCVQTAWVADQFGVPSQRVLSCDDGVAWGGGNAALALEGWSLGVKRDRACHIAIVIPLHWEVCIALQTIGCT